MEEFANWVDDLEARHLADLTFSEVARALRALSSAYVERRSRLAHGVALSGAGKRAAFALFYGPIHYLIVRHITSAHCAGRAPWSSIVDLGCGTGASGAAFASGAGSSASMVGIDRSAWAIAEAARTYRAHRLKGRTVRGDLAEVRWDAAGRVRRGRAATAYVAAFALNEIDAPAREIVQARLLERARRGDTALIVEPIAGSAAPWWGQWRKAFEAAGGRADEWRVPIELPEIVRRLDQAAGLDHRELTARSIYVAGHG